jgi:hypothetical protein
MGVVLLILKALKVLFVFHLNAINKVVTIFNRPLNLSKV